ncbi:MAG: hypothetical protein AAGN82_15265, partial [Myxococcota bacterium]
DEATPEPTVIDNETPSLGRASVAEVEAPARMARMPEPLPAVEASDHGEGLARPGEGGESASDDDVADDDEEDLHGYRAQGVEDEVGEDEGADLTSVPSTPGWRRAAYAFAGSLSTATSGARSAVHRVATAVKTKKESSRRTTGPKRTTAPPPGGAIRTRGRRVVREATGRLRRQHPGQDRDVDVEVTTTPRRGDKRRALFSGVVGVMAVCAVYFASQKIKGATEAETPVADPAVVAAAGPSSAPLDDDVAAPPGGAAPPSAAVATVDVPLFGATPLSTTEVVPVPPEFARPGEVPEEAPEAAAAEAEAPGKSYGALKMEWGVGEVENPTVLRLKMDGKVEGIVGEETSTGFKVVVPGRKSVSSTSGLARKDKRLTAVDVVNYPDRSEVTLRFRKDVPAFVAKAQGKRLIIHISTPGKKSRKKR